MLGREGEGLLISSCFVHSQSGACGTAPPLWMGTGVGWRWLSANRRGLTYQEGVRLKPDTPSLRRHFPALPF